MIEYLAPGFIYSVAKDIWGRVHSRKRKLSAAEVVELRKKWKSEFEPRMWEWYQKKLRDDIIIRDMKRFDSYPDIDENANGISPGSAPGLSPSPRPASPAIVHRQARRSRRSDAHQGCIEGRRPARPAKFGPTSTGSQGGFQVSLPPF